MEVKELIKGIAVIIDNDIETQGTAIYQIKDYLLNEDIPIATYSYLPDTKVISSLAHASFLILDWDYSDKSDLPMEEKVHLGSTLETQEEAKLIHFIDCVIKSTFLPIFLFTGKGVDAVTAQLQEQDIPLDRIFVKSKAEITEAQELFKVIANWFSEKPAAYVLKGWNQQLQKAKDTAFLQLYHSNPNWAPILWNTFKKDTKEVSHELNTFLSRYVLNRMEEFKFEEGMIKRKLEEGTYSQLSSVIEKEGYLEYQGVRLDQASTGDLVKIEDGDNSIYYLNIGAQCPLQNRSKHGNYHPILYCIKGVEMDPCQIEGKKFVCNQEGIITYDGKPLQEYELEKRLELCARANGNLPRVNNGEILERKNQTIIFAVDHGKTICFDLEVCILSWEEYKDHRIGKVLPPFITKIQQKVAQYLIREGVTPLPDQLFEEELETNEKK